MTIPTTTDITGEDWPHGTVWDWTPAPDLTEEPPDGALIEFRTGFTAQRCDAPAISDGEPESRWFSGGRDPVPWVDLIQEDEGGWLQWRRIYTPVDLARIARERDEERAKVEALLLGDKALQSRIWLGEECQRLRAERDRARQQHDELATTETPPTVSPDERNARLDGPVHSWFGLSYSNYQVVPRTLAQSMPVEWQERWVACLEQLHAAFEHIEHPDAYKVEAAREIEYADLDDRDMAVLGVSRPDAPDGGDPEFADPEFADPEFADPGDVFYDADGTEHEGWHRVLVPVADPIPAYNRGRTFIEPGPINTEEG